MTTDKIELSKENLLGSIRVAKTGHGHWRLTATLTNTDDFGDNLTMSAITTDSQLIDSIHSEENQKEYGYDDVEQTMIDIINRNK